MKDATRSRIMRSIRKKDTAPELLVRRAVHGLGYRFRLHSRDLPGSPDLVLPRHRQVILVHGCFWHQHPGCALAKRPRSNVDYWVPKLERNVARDARVLNQLANAGWQTLVLWECEVRTSAVLREKLLSFLKPLSGTSDGLRP
ncbi:T/G mismatch-specific endonuclease [Rhizobiales bacterium GAS113]|nr:T/G mismatch-specific endonuclease [Rhizobiales bacterium GAS113]